MRIEEFLPVLNNSIERYALGIKIFILVTGLFIAYNYFFVPTLLLMVVGIPVYIYTKTRRNVTNHQSYTDWTAQIPPVELAAPAIETPSAPAPAPVPVPAPIESELKSTLQT